MEGLVIWSPTYCRSTLAFYEGLSVFYKVPLKILIWKRDTTLRTSVGFSDNEFSHLDISFIGDNKTKANKFLSEYLNWHHIFGTYQKGNLFRKVIIKAKKLGCHVAIASEAPCNTLSPPLTILKQFYISKLLHLVVAKQIKAADFIINFSGDSTQQLCSIGWTSNKIINCGYYSPPLNSSHFIQRNISHWEDFKILMTGKHEWRRNPMVLLEAIKLLKDRGINCHTIVTQDGPLYTKMINFAKTNNLEIEFVGIVSYTKLVELYQSCSCFVGAGISEPWGIRVNDALNCGAPLIISEGMGAVKLIKDYSCGYSFANNSPIDLADKLGLLINNKNYYMEIANNVRIAKDKCHPFNRARWIASKNMINYSSWS